MEKLKLVSSLPAKPKPPEPGPFAIGDLVHLKSGGPLLTVQASGPEWSHCIWFDDVGNYCGPEEFKNRALAAYVPPKPKRTFRKPKAR